VAVPTSGRADAAVAVVGLTDPQVGSDFRACEWCRCAPVVGLALLSNRTAFTIFMRSKFTTFLRFPLLGLLFPICPVLVRAVEAAPAFALDALVDDIAKNNPELRFYEQEISAAKAGQRVAASWNDAELSIQGGRKRVRDTAGVLAGEGNAWSVSVTQTFEWPGRLALRKAVANRQIELAELGLARFKAALIGRAKNLSYGVFAAEEMSVAAKEVGERYQTLRELYLARDPAGLTPLLDTRVIEAKELAIKRRATEADLAAQEALVELNQLRGAPLEAGLRIAGAELAFHSAPSLTELLAAARDNNFDFRMKKVELEQQGLEVSLARNERHPSVTAGPFVSHETGGDQQTIVGLGMSVPLPLSSRSRAGVDLAESRRRQAETMLLVAQRQLEREVITASQAFAAKVAAMSAWQPDAVEKFREAAALADRHYRLGAVPLSTYIELQNSYLDAVEALLNTKREALEAGQQIELLTGLNFAAVEAKP
jgi:cobalt-zinc-cadmium efflux system outer membrane protein